MESEFSDSTTCAGERLPGAGSSLSRVRVRARLAGSVVDARRSRSATQPRASPFRPRLAAAGGSRRGSGGRLDLRLARRAGAAARLPERLGGRRCGRLRRGRRRLLPRRGLDGRASGLRHHRSRADGGIASPVLRATIFDSSLIASICSEMARRMAMLASTRLGRHFEHALLQLVARLRQLAAASPARPCAARRR